MFHEYALDPSTLRCWADFRYLIDQFGMSQGRLISKFPSKWKKVVYDACSGIAPVERSKIEEGLRRIDLKLYAAGRDYDTDLDWIQNAVRSHINSPFRAIITAPEKATTPDCLDHSALSADTDRWQSGIPPVRRSADDMAAAAEKLLRSSSQIVFVDQHYSCMARHGRPLKAFLRYAIQGASIKRIEYHLGCGASSDWFEEKLRKQARFLGLPDEVDLVFYRWKEKPDGEEFHGRYILTELGGIRFDVGLDDSEDTPGIQTTDVAALDHATYSLRWSQHGPNSMAFEPVDSWRVTNNDVERLERFPEMIQPSPLDLRK